MKGINSMNNNQKAEVRSYKYYLMVIAGMLLKARDTFNVFGDKTRSAEVSKDDRFEFTPKEIDYNGGKVTVFICSWNKDIRFDALKNSAASDPLVNQYLTTNGLTIHPDNDKAIAEFFKGKNFIVESSDQLPALWSIHPPVRERVAAL